MSSIFVLGDSISMQYGPHLERALGSAYAYSRKDGKELANLDLQEGANGGDSGRVRAFLEGWVALDAPPHFDRMLVNCGLHDIKLDPDSGERQVPPLDYARNLPAIIAAAQKLADSVVWIRTTPVDDELHAQRKSGFGRRQADVEAYNELADGIMAGARVPSIDLHGFSAALNAELCAFRDGVHFLDNVMAQQGAFIAGWIIAADSAR